MKINFGNKRPQVLFLLAGILVSSLSMAASNDRNQGRDDNGNERNENNARGDNPAADHRGRFEDRQRVVVRDYFSSQARAGKCPPGLAKKGNGCNPPGQVRHWQLGQALPSNAMWYELENDLVRQLGQPPVGYRYAGVDNNILLLELGTQVVVDVIQALSE